MEIPCDLVLQADQTSTIHHHTDITMQYHVAVHKGHIRQAFILHIRYFSRDSNCQLLRRIVGDCPELGDWQPTEGVKLRTSSYAFPIWYLGRL